MRHKETIEDLIRLRAIFNEELSYIIMEKNKKKMIKHMEKIMMKEEYSFYEINYEIIDMDKLLEGHLEDLESDLSWAL